MIRSLEIRDLVVIPRAELAPPPGLTAITGETGAGKTVLAQALGLLTGAPADPSAVRPGARHALVQATVALADGFWDGLDEDDPAGALRELVDDEREVVIARRVPAEGRARALLDGQAAPREAVGSLARAVMRFSAQHEARRLVSPAAQLAALDAFVGADATTAAERLARLRRRLRGLERGLAEARARRDAAERRRAELEELVADVEAAGLEPDEEGGLRAERERLRHAQRIGLAVAAAAEAIAPTDANGAGAGDGGALAAIGRASRSLADVSAIDPALARPEEGLLRAEAELAEAGIALRGYLDDLDAQPGRLAQVEERLEIYVRLGRRYGPSAAEVLRQAAAAREALASLDDEAREDDVLAREHAATLAEAHDLAAYLRGLRRDAAPRLSEAAAAELSQLAMPGAALRVELGTAPGDPPGDTCTIWLRPNPGLPEAPLADAASGGELSRVLLALHGVAAGRDGAAWVFDEVDAGIGGATAAAMGQRLAALARGRQVLVITHLPQIAALADAHFRLVKEVGADGRASTRIESLEGDALVAELCQMLGAGPADAGARRHAEELLARRHG